MNRALRASPPATGSQRHPDQAVAATSRRRVVYLDHCARQSGAELALLRTLPELRSVQPLVVLAEEGPLVGSLTEQGIEVRLLPMKEAGRGLPRDAVRPGWAAIAGAYATLSYVVRLARLLRAEHPDLVETNSLKSAIYGALAGLGARVPVVWHIHDRVATDYMPRPAVTLVRLFGRLLPTAVIANSETTLTTLHLKRGPRRPRVVASIAPPSPLAGGSRRASGEGAGEVVVGMVGRIQPWKGQDVFLKAFAAAFPNSGARAVVVGGALFGEDQFARSMKDLAAALGIADRVRFTGHLDDPVPEMERFDLLVHASVVPEPFGQVVVEGMALGLPVVASGAGGPAEVITDGVDGLLYPPGDVTALAAHLRRLSADPGLRRRLGSAGANTAARYAPNVIARELEAVYDQVLAGGRHAERPADRAVLRVLRVSHSGVVGAWRQRERSLTALGAEVTLAAARRWAEGGGMVALHPSPGERVTGLRTIGQHPCGFAYEPVGLWRVLRSVPHDILDVHEEPYSVAAAEIVVVRSLARQRAPMVFYSAQNLRKQHPLPVRVAERLVFASAKGAYPCNEAAAANLRRKGFRGVVQVIPLGVEIPGDTAKTASRAHPGDAVGRLFIGCAGRLTPEKGFHVVVDAIAGEPGWHLQIVGDGPERLNIADRAKKVDAAKRVELLGYRDSATMADFYRSIDVLVVPSLPTPGWEEQFGRVVVEAMAAGVPVVSTTSGSLPEVVGDAGVLVPPGDAAELHRALAALAADPEERRRLARKGLERARSYTWEAVARQQLALYDTVLADSHRKHVEPGQPDQRSRLLPGIDVVVVAYGRPELLTDALAALCSDDPQSDLGVIVVDNSSNASISAVAQAHGARYVDPGANLGFGAAVNLALANLSDKDSDVLLLNPDAEVGARTVRLLQERLHAESRLACVAPRQNGADGEAQRVGWPFPSPAGYWLEAVGLGRLRRKPGFLIGSVLLLNRAALRDLGGFDEAFFLYGEETDWQRRARDAGWGNRLCDDLQARHIGAATSSGDPVGRELLFAGGQERYLRKWYGRTGWQLARAAIVAGALARGVVLSGERRRAALDRARRFAAGPLRLAAAKSPGR